MTNRTAWPTVGTGDSWSASQHNTYGRDNDLAYWVYTTPGDIPYATASNALARLGVTAYGTLVGNSGGSAPEYNQPPFVTQPFYDTTGHTYSTNAWRNMPNSSDSITTLVTSTVFCVGSVVAYGGATYGFRNFCFSIDGTELNPYQGVETYGIDQNQTTVFFGEKTGVTAGSKTILVRECCTAGSYTVSRIHWWAFAIPERA